MTPLYGNPGSDGIESWLRHAALTLSFFSRQLVRSFTGVSHPIPSYAAYPASTQDGRTTPIGTDGTILKLMQERRRYGTLNFLSFPFLSSIRHYLPMENVRISPNRSLGKSAINTTIASQKDADKGPTDKGTVQRRIPQSSTELRSH